MIFCDDTVFPNKYSENIVSKYVLKMNDRIVIIRQKTIDFLVRRNWK